MKWIISNHKNFFDSELIDDYIKELNSLQLSNVKLIICPAPKNLFYFKNQNFILGSQDIKNIDDLMDSSVKYTIVGHSYRRNKYNETDEEINEKIKLLLSNGICPVLCVGEEEGENVEIVLKQQLELGLKGIKGEVIIAYEPVWAISSGKMPSIDKLVKIVNYIEEITNELGINAIILYGGSVNKDTVLELEKIDTISGYLVGAASVDIEKLKELIDMVEGD